MTPHICFTASAFLIHEAKVLLIKHKKLAMWLGPGGHIDQDELPHQAAVREFFEETGLQVEIVSALPVPVSPSPNLTKTDVFHPVPLAVNEHWVCRENFTARQAAIAAKVPYVPNPLWSKGCERHLNFTYLVKLAGPMNINPAPGESQEVGFFSQQDVADTNKLLLAPAIATEVTLAFKLAKQLAS